MSDWRDVMEARREADDAFRNARDSGAMSDVSRVVLHIGLAICLELRALGTTLDYGRAQ